MNETTERLNRIENKILNLDKNDPWNKIGQYFNEIQSHSLYRGETKFSSRNFSDWMRTFCKNHHLSYASNVQRKTQVRRLARFVYLYNLENEENITVDQAARKIPFKSVQNISRIVGPSVVPRLRSTRWMYNYMLKAYQGKISSFDFVKIANKVSQARQFIAISDESQKQNLQTMTRSALVKDDSWLKKFYKVPTKRANSKHPDPFHKPFYRVLRAMNSNLNMGFDNLVLESQSRDYYIDTFTVHFFKAARNFNLTLRYLSRGEFSLAADYYWVVVPPNTIAKGVVFSGIMWQNFKRLFPNLLGAGIMTISSNGRLEILTFHSYSKPLNLGQKINKISAKNKLLTNYLRQMFISISQENIQDSTKTINHRPVKIRRRITHPYEDLRLSAKDFIELSNILQDDYPLKADDWKQKLAKYNQLSIAKMYVGYATRQVMNWGYSHLLK